MTNNFTPELIAADREINGKATPGDWTAKRPTEMQYGYFLNTDSSVSILATRADAEFCANARTRFPLALDEIERLQAEFHKMDLLRIAAESEVDQQDAKIEAMSAALVEVSKEANSYGCNHEDQQDEESGLCGGDDCKRCYLLAITRSMPDAVARGKKILEDLAELNRLRSALVLLAEKNL